MKADVVIIGGGLASLVAGIKLQKAGKSVIIVSAGQSALHFSSGSMGLLGRFEGKDVERPLEFIDRLDEKHPYRKVGGSERVKALLTEATSILTDAGIRFKGNFEKNHYKLTPFGVFSPEWLTLSDHLTVGNPDEFPWKHVALIGIKGFLDFFPEYIKKGLEKRGVECDIHEVDIKEFDLLRMNPTEMRAPNIARALTEDALDRFGEEINRHIGNNEIAIIPAVVGLDSYEPMKMLQEATSCPLYSVATTPTAVPGIRMQILLRRHFKALGGWYLNGDMVTDGILDNHRVKSLNTVNLGVDALKADHYLLATGSFFSHGLKATSKRILEPIFDLDVDSPDDRQSWYDHDIFKPQPFMRFGVKTDENFHCMKDGKRIENLRAIGNVTGGCDPLYDGVGAGVAMSTALSVTDHILKG